VRPYAGEAQGGGGATAATPASADSRAGKMAEAMVARVGARRQVSQSGLAAGPWALPTRQARTAHSSQLRLGAGSRATDGDADFVRQGECNRAALRHGQPLVE
jgi:hypothetical protein